MISAGHKTGPVSLAVVSGALLLLYVFRHITHRTSAGDLISLGDKQNAKWLAQHVTVRHEVHNAASNRRISPVSLGIAPDLPPVRKTHTG